MNEPFFSIVIPTYNRAPLITKTIQSTLNQYFKGDYEVLIIDDGSTDDTETVINSITDKKVKYYRISNRERGAARNFGTEKSKGQYITFLDSDDILHPDYLSNAFKMIRAQGNLEIFHLGYQIIDTNNRILAKYYHVQNNNLNTALLKGNYMSCIGVFLRRDIAIKYKFSENRNISGTEDWLLWLELAARYDIKFSNEISASMIDHENRSIKNYNTSELHQRTVGLITSLENDEKFKAKFGNESIRKIHAHMLTYSSLHLMLSKNKKDAWNLFIKGISLNPSEIFSRRTLAILKHSIL